MMRACTFIGYTPCTSLPLCRKHKHSSCGSLAHFLYTFFIPARTAADFLFRFAHLPEGEGRNHPLITTKLHKGLTPVAAHYASQIPFPGVHIVHVFCEIDFCSNPVEPGNWSRLFGFHENNLRLQLWAVALGQRLFLVRIFQSRR